MLYKILLSLNYNASNTENQSKASEQLISNNWRKIDDSELVWMSEIIAYDLLSAKFRVERDLNIFFRVANIQELSYAFQLSLGDITTGKLKTSF